MMSTQGYSNRVGVAVRACENWASLNPLRFSLVAVFILLAVALVAFQPSYDTNDDVYMSLIAAGKGFCPAPDEHLIFTNVLIGHGLKRLYTAWPQIPWYGIYLFAVHYLTQVALLYCALTAGFKTAVRGVARPIGSDLAAPTPVSTRRRLSMYLVYFAVVELFFFNNLQFTSTAFLSAQTGILLFWLAWQRRAGQPDAPLAGLLFAAGFFVVLAALIRLECLPMALLIAAPLGFSLTRQASRRTLLPFALVAASVASLIFLATTYDRLSYERDPKWSGFFGYNQLRIKFNDYCWTQYKPQTAHVFSAVGWTKNDYQMIAHWFFDDPVLYSQENLHTVLDSYPWKTARLTGDYYWHTCRGLLKDQSIWAAMLVLPFFLTAIDRRGNGRWSVIGCTCVAVAAVAFLTVNAKLPPPRVYFPTLAFSVSVAMLLSISSPSVESTNDGAKPFPALTAWKQRPSLASVVVVLLITSIVINVYRQGRRSVQVVQKRAALQTFLTQLHPSGHKLYICWGAALPFELISPLDNLAQWSRMPMVNLAWTQRTPWHEELKRRFEIPSLAQAICEREDVVLVAMEIHLGLFTTFAKEHFQSDIEFVELQSFGKGIVAGHFHRFPRAGQTVGMAAQPAR